MGSGLILLAADRIDAAADGTIAIYDYKSSKNSVPTEKQLFQYSPQVPLEAELVERGAYEDLPAPGRLHLEFIALFNPEERYVRDLTPDQINGIWARFLNLLRHYQNEATGYASQYRPYPNTQFEGDYDHLARKGEWDDDAEPEVIHVGRP